uniref:RNA-directed DNA polymerase, eukaryota, reverse transcriptase zinc-binding domain protein n=1 Tax=Tanacetum cinerariifolium TaxID=118510 RepID=A0A6L2N7V7_TANCI|nr:RNA-directed DNA polymerase, eukaryota, reverse transcriptase zinc-binding domain protein [Tanacetum cinerariifolium]
MEVFNLTLHKKISEDSNFKYHFGCKSLKITHLSFADDLLALSHGDVNSIKVIKKALDSFSEVSVMYPNLGKSTVFCGSMENSEIDEILQILPFKREKLHVRYLGVPLISKKIGVKDCKSLIDKVKAKVMDWKNHSLSYAGRVQRIASGFYRIKGISKEEKLKFHGRRNHMQFNIGNRRKASVWHDRWCLRPALDTIVSRKDVYAAGFTNEDIVADCILEDK